MCFGIREISRWVVAGWVLFSFSSRFFWRMFASGTKVLACYTTYKAMKSGCVSQVAKHISFYALFDTHFQPHFMGRNFEINSTSHEKCKGIYSTTVFNVQSIQTPRLSPVFPRRYLNQINANNMHFHIVHVQRHVFLKTNCSNNLIPSATPP